jgi:putative ABC transport system ATP-binding protein
MQRTAIARALFVEPRVLFADEPTGNLDRRAGEEIMRILHSLNVDRQLTIVIVTHDMAVARSTNRVVRLADNKIQTETNYVSENLYQR